MLTFVSDSHPDDRIEINQEEVPLFPMEIEYDRSDPFARFGTIVLHGDDKLIKEIVDSHIANQEGDTSLFMKLGPTTYEWPSVNVRSLVSQILEIEFEFLLRSTYPDWICNSTEKNHTCGWYDIPSIEE